VFELSQEIEQAAEIGDWVMAARLVEVRPPLLMSINGEQASASPVLIAQIRAINHIIMEKARSRPVALYRDWLTAVADVGVVD